MPACITCSGEPPWRIGLRAGWRRLLLAACSAGAFCALPAFAN